MGNEQSQQQTQLPSSSTANNVNTTNANIINNNNSNNNTSNASSSFNYNPNASNVEKRARKKQTGIRLAPQQIESMPSSKISNNVEVDEDINEEQFLSSVQSAYGSNAKVEINTSTLSNNYNNSNNYSNNSNGKSRKQISYQVTFNSNKDALNAYNDNANYQQKIMKDLGLKGSAIAFDNPCEPKSIDGITLQLDSDSSSILCGACLIYNYKNECINTIHYSNRIFDAGVISHSGDTKVHGKSVHTIKLGLSDLDNKKVKQLFFTLCACGPSDLSKFKEPVISLHENDNPDINLIQYPIEQAGNARSVVMCRIFRNENDNNESNWSIQALGTKEWHISEKVCMHYEYAIQLINAHLKESNKDDKNKSNDK